ncbi:MAG: ABC transporter permease [Gammaproteobacteria bacterium]|nr:ABC transporter permease [Gammaproteobacteria bacterium]
MFHGYLPTILGGALLTLELAVLSLVFALVAGLAGAAAKLSRSMLLRTAATVYTTVVRGVPDLVMMLLVFYGGQMVVNHVTEHFDLGYFDLNPMVAGVLTIGFIFGGYFAETFRGAFLAVPAGQLEAGAAYGMTRWQVFARILFPQMLRHALPGLGNNWLVLLKSTAIVSMIGLSDMTWLADQAGRTTREPFLFYLLVCVLYLAMTTVSSWLLARLEKRYSAGVRAAEL